MLKNVRDIISNSKLNFIYKTNGDLYTYDRSNFEFIDDKKFLMNDKSIIKIIYGRSDIIFYRDNYHIIVYDNLFSQFLIGDQPSLNIYNEHVTLINGISFSKISPENYKNLSILTQELIFEFYLCLKSIQNNIKLKLPKFIIYEILKFL